MKICPKCGYENSNNSKYCESCGSVFSGTEEPAGLKGKIMTTVVGVLALTLIAGGTLLFFKDTDLKSNASSTNVAKNAMNGMASSIKPAPFKVSDYVIIDDKHVIPSSLPNDFYVYNGHTYGFYNADAYGLDSYSKVALFCQQQGGHLGVINDSKENKYLFDLVRNNYDGTAFFGYSDERQEGKWVWEGDDSDYENWTRYGDWNLPDNGEGWGGGEWKNGGEDYAEFNYDIRKSDIPNDGTWNDAAFRENTDIFICEWEYDVEKELY